MPILTLQRSLRRLGRIRMGDQVKAANGKTRPNKLETWRLTSPVEDLLQAAAQRYGGEVHPWEGAPGGTKQFELYTTTDTLEALIPPTDMAFQQFFEMWSGGGCVRRCDGETEITSGEPCLCPADPDEKQKLAGEGKACKPISRLFVVLPYLPDVGMWHLEARGYYAATELPGTIEVLRLAAAGGNMIPTRLRIDQRSVKRDGKTISFAVPVIELPTLSTHSLMTGEVPVGELGEGLREIGAGAIADQGLQPVDGQTAQSVENPGEPAPPASNSPAASRTRSPGEQLHRDLGRLGFKDKGEHEELIFNASGGRTTHGSELTDKERSAVVAMAEDVTQGRQTWAKITEANDAHRAKQEEAGRPLPAAGSGDGANMRRMILNKAQRTGLDGAALEELSLSVTGKRFAEIADSDAANKLLKAVS